MDQHKERLFSSHEAGELLQMDPSSVVKWVRDGKLPAYRTPGGHRRIKQSDLLAFLKKHGMYVPPVLQASAAKRLLLIDDDAAMLSALARALRSHKERVEVHTAQGGIEGLVQVGALKPDLVVLDLHMAGMDGLEVLERLRAADETRGIGVAVLTGRVTAELKRRAPALSLQAILHKPISASDLLVSLGLIQPSAE